MNGNKIFILNLRGSLDSVSATDFRKYLDSKIKEGHLRFLLQMNDLDFVTSFGISFLLKMKEEADTGKYAFAMTGLNTEILSLFALLGIGSRLPVFSVRNDAENFLQSWQEKTGSGFSFHDEEASAKKLFVEETIVAGPKPDPADEIETKSEEKNSGQKIHYYSTPEEKTEISEKVNVAPEINFTEAVIFCESCNARLKIKQTGRHRCPGCQTEFEVRSNGSVTWLEKLLQ